MRTSTQFILVLLAMSFIVAPFFSCKKSAGPADCIITVVDSSGSRIAGATVILKQDSVINPTNGVQASVLEEGKTGGLGSVAFSFKLEAVLNIEASKGAKSGKDFIRLEQGNTVTKTVVID